MIPKFPEHDILIDYGHGWSKQHTETQNNKVRPQTTQRTPTDNPRQRCASNQLKLSGKLYILFVSCTDIVGDRREKGLLIFVGRCDTYISFGTLMQQGVMKGRALFTIFNYCTLSTSITVRHSMISTSSLLATKTYVVFFGNIQALFGF